ncbi:MAG: hypothetical protein QXV81_06875 [Ignisphaera sp.]
MPLELKNVIPTAVYRCEVCGKTTSTPILYKTCCMNKPVALCSRECLNRWISEWIKNQEQILRNREGARKPLRKLYV